MIARMSRHALPLLLCWLCADVLAQAPDPRLRDVVYDPHAVVTIPVRVGVVTLIVLDADEAIAEVASGIGADCTKPESAWCVAAQPGGRTVFVKPKSSARSANNLAVITDRRSHNFRFVVLGDTDRREPVYRLTVKAPVRSSVRAQAMPPVAATLVLPPLPALLSPREVVAERLEAKPEVVNADYSIAADVNAQDIVPTLVFDDGRFTYFGFPGNREVPAVFHVLPDGGETLVNARMEDNLLVVDRVSRRLVLRAGSAVVGVWNEAFDLDGKPLHDGTTVAGVQRSMRSGGPTRRTEPKHD